MLNEIKNIYLLALKDIKAYYFKPGTISWGILFPLVFIFIFSLKNPYNMTSIMAGLLSMSIFFGTTSMTATSIMIERRINIFNLYYTLPISYYGIALGKILSGMLFGIFTTLIMLLIVVIFFNLHIYSIWLLVAWLLISSFALSSIGVFMSLIVKEAYDAMIYMNLIRLPLLFVSGIFVPISKLPASIKVFAYISPLTYPVDISKAVFNNNHFINLGISFLILILLSIILLIISAYRVKAIRQ